MQSKNGGIIIPGLKITSWSFSFQKLLPPFLLQGKPKGSPPSQLLQLQLWRLLGFAAGFLMNETNTKGEETKIGWLQGNEFKNIKTFIRYPSHLQNDLGNCWIFLPVFGEGAFWGSLQELGVQLTPLPFLRSWKVTARLNLVLVI